MASLLAMRLSPEFGFYEGTFLCALFAVYHGGQLCSGLSRLGASAVGHDRFDRIVWPSADSEAFVSHELPAGIIEACVLRLASRIFRRRTASGGSSRLGLDPGLADRSGMRQGRQRLADDGGLSAVSSASPRVNRGAWPLCLLRTLPPSTAIGSTSNGERQANRDWPSARGVAVMQRPMVVDLRRQQWRQHCVVLG